MHSLPPGHDSNHSFTVWLIVGAICLVYSILLVHSCSTCEDKGGKLVEGLGWYECVESR